jgi:hypothetical protein
LPQVLPCNVRFHQQPHVWFWTPICNKLASYPWEVAPSISRNSQTLNNSMIGNFIIKDTLTNCCQKSLWISCLGQVVIDWLTWHTSSTSYNEQFCNHIEHMLPCKWAHITCHHKQLFYVAGLMVFCWVHIWLIILCVKGVND